MKIRFALLTVAVLAVTATSAFAAPFFYNVGEGVSTGISSDGVAISYNNASTTYIYSQTGGAYSIATGASAGNTASGVAKIGSDYVVVYNSNTSGAYKAYCWKGGLNGVGTTTAAPDTTFWARGVGGNGTDLNQCYVAGQYSSGGNTVVGRWKAPAGSVAGYSTASGMAASNQTFYAASYGGVYAGQGRLSSAGTVTKKEQAIVLQGSSLIMLRSAGGAPSTSYYSTAQAIAGDASVTAGYTGASDNSTAQACYWNRDAAYTTSTACNLIPFLDGYTKSYAMRINGDGNIIAGYQAKATNIGLDKRTIFIYNKATNTVSDLRAILTNAGIDMNAWGLMDITGVSADGRKLTGTMLASTDTYWNGGAVSTAYNSFMIDLDGTVVPEPGSILALGTGLVGLFGMIRRRK